MFRIALANLPYPTTPDDAVTRVLTTIAAAARTGARIVCFPECYVPGYRGLGHAPPPADAAFLERAWTGIAEAAGAAEIAVVLGTERIVDGELVASALVVGPRGERLGFQDKVQIDPSEDGTYTPGRERSIFRVHEL